MLYNSFFLSIRLLISKKSVPLHRVFHSIRFKVNKGWSKALLLFLCPYVSLTFFDQLFPFSIVDTSTVREARPGHKLYHLKHRRFIFMMPMKRYHQSWLPAMFDDFFDNEWMKKTNATAPAINVIESDTEYKVEVAAPGMNKEDFNIHVDESGNLVIAMEKKSEKKEEDKKSRYLRREFSYTKFQQTLILPEDVVKDTINASMCDGVLCIELPRKTPEAKNNITKVIEIK